MNTIIEAKLEELRKIGKKSISELNNKELQDYATLAKDIWNLLINQEEERQRGVKL